MIKMILASNTNGGIGFEGKLPWHIPEDLQYFKEMTYRQAIVMGSKTFESLNFQKLPDRKNIVLTSGGGSGYVGLNRGIVNKVSNLDWLLKCGVPFLKRFGGYDTWIIGGASIYEQLFPYVEEIHHTVVYGDYECDTFVDTDKWVGNPSWKLIETKVLSERATVFIWRKVK